MLSATSAVHSLGPELTRGSRSIVHQWGQDAIAKVPLPRTPPGWIRFEAAYATAVYSTGVACPQVLGLEQVNGTEVSVFERVVGPTMWQTILENPTDVAVVAAGHLLGRLHAEILCVGGPISLPSQCTRTKAKLHEAARIHDPRYVDLVTIIPADVTATVLCHGDFHPMNIIMSENGPVIVDWFDASRGRASGDIARTLLLLGTSNQTHLPNATPELLTAVRETYLETVMALTNTPIESVQAWARIQEVARLAEGIEPMTLF
jgi:thiamine kinase